MVRYKKIKICIILTFLFFIKSFGQNETVENYNVENGLSSNWVSCFQLDNQGFLWMGTQNGLTRFDGINTENYHNKPFNNNSLASNWVHNIVKDETGNFWLGTIGGGLQRFNPYEYIFDKDFSINGQQPTVVKAINLVDNKIWVATEKGLLMAKKPYKDFTYITKSYFQNISNVNNDYLLLSNEKGVFLFHKESNSIKKILTRNKQTILEINTNNLFVLDNQFISKYQIKDSLINKLSSHKLNFEDSNSTLWGSAKLFSSSYGILITSNKKIYKYNETTNSLTPFLEFSKKSNNTTILNYYETNTGDLWVGTKNGAFLLSNHNKTYKKANNGWQGIKDIKVREIQLENDILWIANENGLKSYYKNKVPTTYLKGNITAFKKINHNLFAAGKNENNQVFFWHLNLKNGTTKSFALKNFSTEGVIWKILQDEDKVIIAGRYNFGYYHLKDQSLQFKKRVGDFDFNALVVTDLLKHKNELFIATIEGLLIIKNGNLNTIEHFINDRKTGLTNHLIIDLHKDKNQNIWLATEGGLHLYNEKNATFKHWGKAEGLLDSKVLTIESDKQGMLWLGTNSMGLFKFNPLDESFTHFDKKLGLSSNEFLMSASFGKDNQLFFGTEDEIVTFNSNSLKLPQKDTLQLRIETIRVNKGIDSKILDKKTPNDFILPHNYGNLSFHFNAPNYYNPRATTYAYKVNGLYNSWVDLGTSNSFSLVNLSHGNYQIQIKAENPLSKTSVQSFELTVKKAFYNTYWAWIIYMLSIFGTLFYFWKHFKNKLIIKNKLEILKEINSLKSKMFTNISHEFRTPLTLIKGSIEQLEQNFDEKLSMDAVKMIRRNTNRVLNLVNQLLDLSKIDEGNLHLKLTEGDVYKCLSAATSSFNSLAAQHYIDYKVQIPSGVLWASFDRNKLEKVVYNLLSNAFKFSDEGSVISCDTTYNGQVLQVQVNDSGKGINKEKLPFIFDRFFQADSSNTKEKEGSGIGLSLVKELVEFMDGTITVNSELNKGSFFTFQIPIQEIMTRQKSSKAKSQVKKDIHRPQSFTFTSIDKRKVPSILLIEDNNDMRSFIKEQLIKFYKIDEAINGEEGLSTAITNPPDLIITDLMMPKMDGITLCEKLKTNVNTSHIPVIMLTAKAGIDNKIEGLETGADDYLTKPFDAGELLVRIKNLIEQRQKLRELFTNKEVQIDPKKVTVTSIDQKFLEKVLNLLENQFSDPGFGVLQMQENLAMSKAQLHRKLKALTNEAPSELLRNFRLKRAAQLLSQKADTVSQIAYKVGFNDLSYFAKRFKELYGVSPSLYYNS